MAASKMSLTTSNSVPNLSMNPLTWWKWWITPRATTREAAFYERNTRGIMLLLAVAFVAASVAFIPSGVLAGYEMVMVIFFVFLGAVAISIVAGKIGIASWMLASIQLLVAFTTLYTSGYWAPNAVGMLIVTPIVTALLVHNNWSKLFFAVAVLTLFAATAFYQESIGFVSIFDPSYSFSTPSGAFTFFSILMFLFVGSGAYFLYEFRSQQNELRHLIENLEERVADRTRDLTIAADVSTQVSSILDLNTLLPQVVDELRSAYDYYHVSVFLLDEASKTLNLAASAGRNNRKLDNMQFKLDSQGIVPKAARTRQPVFIGDVRNEPSYYANPALPDTRMEGSIPMIVGNRVIGVLDIQLDWMEDFAADRLGIAVSLATQIGIAVQNAQSYTEAQAARQQAMDANKIKSMFLANMSHELRTPLNAILNFTAFVADGTLGEVNAEQVETLEEAIASGRHLLSLINDVLDITKIEAGLMDLFIQDVDMNEIVSSVAAVGKGLVKDKSITLNTEIEPNLPITYGDKRRLRQVFLNMLSNAVKFTPEGQVTIRAKAIANGVRVEVQDTGIGIAPEDQSLVFESFKQAKHDLQEAVGTGLGMPISRYFVESHGGKMWLTSERGKGSTFYVELPVLTEEQANAINMSMVEQVA
jgi:signal transduction histidine kinase